jgi:hypothetical protein
LRRHLGSTSRSILITRSFSFNNGFDDSPTETYWEHAGWVYSSCPSRGFPIVPTYSIASTCHTLTANIPIKLKVF